MECSHPSGVSPSFTEELRDHFVERFGQASLTQTVPHWWGLRNGGMGKVDMEIGRFAILGGI